MEVTDLDVRPKRICTERLPREELGMRLMGGPETLSLTRTCVADFASSMPFTQQQIDDIKLAVGEAVANALRHGHGCDCAWVDLRASRRGNALRISVTDHGCGFSPAELKLTQPGDAMMESGRGITLMRALMDTVHFRRGPVGTCVVMTKRCG